MLKIIFSILVSLSFINAASCSERESIADSGCKFSFAVPNGLEYVRLSDELNSSSDVCHLPFMYVGKLKRLHTGVPPSMSEDWRAQADFVLTFKNISVADEVSKIKSADGGAQAGIFKLRSKDQLRIMGGEGYMFTYDAVKPTASMLRLGQSQEIVFIIGNADRSTVYLLYPSGPELRRRQEVAVLKKLLSSFDFTDKK